MPTFDPNKPFEVDNSPKSEDTNKPKFDPNKPFEKEEMGILEAGARGAGQSLFGLSDEAVAAAKTAGKLLMPGSDVTTSNIGESYRTERDKQRQLNEQAWQEQPVAYGAGYVGGTLGQAFVPGLNVAKGASIPAAAGKGALIGGVQGFGSSEADLTKGNLFRGGQNEVGDLVKDIGVGAVTGGAIGGATQLASKVLGKKAIEETEKQSGLFTKRGGKMLSEGRVLSGEQLLEEGAVPFSLTKTSKGIAEKIKPRVEQAGQDVRNAYMNSAKKANSNLTEAIDEAFSKYDDPYDAIAHLNTMATQFGETADNIAYNLRQKAEEMAKSPALGKQAQAKIISKHADEFSKLKEKTYTPEKLWEFQKDFDKLIYQDNMQKKGTEGLKIIRDTIKESVDNSIKATLGEEGFQNFVKANKDYSRWKANLNATISQSYKPDKRMGSITEEIRRGFGLTETGVGIHTMHKASKILPETIAPAVKAGANIMTPQNKKKEEE